MLPTGSDSASKNTPALSPIGLNLTEITEYDPVEYKGMMKPFGPASEAAIKRHELAEDTHVYLHEQYAHRQHTDWYVNLVINEGLACAVAYDLTVAMHLDANIPFDEGTCISPSAQMWEACNL
jgi:hypothetical protein